MAVGHGVAAMRILVCGSRDWDDWRGMLWFCRLFLNGDVLIEGGAQGADSLARRAVEAHGYGTVLEYPADWGAHGRAAGPIRNQRMLDEGKPDVVWAFTDDLATSKGTADMVRRARKAGIPVYVVSRPA